jgi:hypothetical protein
MSFLILGRKLRVGTGGGSSEPPPAITCDMTSPTTEATISEREPKANVIIVWQEITSKSLVEILLCVGGAGKVATLQSVAQKAIVIGPKKRIPLLAFQLRPPPPPQISPSPSSTPPFASAMERRLSLGRSFGNPRRHPEHIPEDRG